MTLRKPNASDINLINELGRCCVSLVAKVPVDVPVVVSIDACVPLPPPTALCALALAALASPAAHAAPPDGAGLELGLFSVSLTVKDIRASKAFYEQLDFKQVGGKLEQIQARAGSELQVGTCK